MADAALILAMCFLFVYGFRLMARLDRFLSLCGKDSLLQPEYTGKTHMFRQFFILYFSGESLRCIALTRFQWFPLFLKKREENGIIGAEMFRFH